MSKRSEKGYQLYKSLGKERTYTKVAELMGLSIKTVETWGYKEKWQEKINEEYEKKEAYKESRSAARKKSTDKKAWEK